MCPSKKKAMACICIFNPVYLFQSSTATTLGCPTLWILSLEQQRNCYGGLYTINELWHYLLFQWKLYIYIKNECLKECWGKANLNNLIQLIFLFQTSHLMTLGRWRFGKKSCSFSVWGVLSQSSPARMLPSSVSFPYK